MALRDGTGGISRRTLLVGGGVGVGLLLGWTLWPRSYAPNLVAAEGEQVLGAFLKIGTDGRVIVAVPQAELGQGSYTSLPQILADELGAAWETIAVEPSPIGPLYANRFVAGEDARRDWPAALHDVAVWSAQEQATRSAAMVTGRSTSIRAFEAPLREAGAGARALLQQAAAARWGVEWDTLDARDGFVVDGRRRLAFAELAEAAAGLSPPDQLPVRGGNEGRLIGRAVPRLDLPSKVDGSAQFAGDIRLPDMVYAAVRGSPIGRGRLVRADQAAAEAVGGVIAVFDNPGWIGAAATNWWAANRAVEAMKPAYEMDEPIVDDASIAAALDAAVGGEAHRIQASGDLAAAYAGRPVYRARYSVGPLPQAPLETLTATARIEGDRIEVWAPTQVPALARAAAARAAGTSETLVTIHRTLIGGGYGVRIEQDAIVQAVVMALKLKRPVQLVRSRIEEAMQEAYGAPARGVMSAAMTVDGRVTGWQARIAAPAAEHQAMARAAGSVAPAAVAHGAAVEGALPPYRIPAVVIDHLPVDVGLKTGMGRGRALVHSTFFTESFVDELARKAGMEPFGFRIQMIAGNPRLARCLTTATALGGWDGGGNGSAMGLAAASALGSHIALLVEVEVTADQRIRVTRAFAAVDCGQIVHPDIVRQLVEGGILHGIALATGDPVRIARGVPEAKGFDASRAPRLADSPEISVELIDSDEEPGGVTELGVLPAAPAIANAVFAATGRRLRTLPLVIGGR